MARRVEMIDWIERPVVFFVACVMFVGWLVVVTWGVER